MATFDACELAAALEAVYRATGVPPGEASVVVRHQLDANLMGHDSHGVITPTQYLRQIDRGEIVPGAVFEVEQESPTTAVVNGHWRFGFVITDQAGHLGIDKARSTGAAALVVRQQGHMGHLGAYASTIANEGLIALVTGDSGRGPRRWHCSAGEPRVSGPTPFASASRAISPARSCWTWRRVRYRKTFVRVLGWGDIEDNIREKDITLTLRVRHLVDLFCREVGYGFGAGALR